MQSDPRHYACMPRRTLSSGDFQVRSVQPDDIEDIRQWRNAQIRVLRQTAVITAADQVSYFEREIWPTLDQAEPSNILLTLFKAGARIGYGGLVHVNWRDRRAEVSFLLTPEWTEDAGRYQQAFRAFFGLVQDLAFDDLDLRKLTTEAFSFRTDVVAQLEACGFQPEGRLREHVLVDGVPTDSLIHGLLATDRKR